MPVRLDSALSGSLTRNTSVQGVNGGRGGAAIGLADIGNNLNSVASGIGRIGEGLAIEQAAEERVAEQQKQSQNALDAVRILGEFDVETNRINADAAAGFDGQTDLTAFYEEDFKTRRQAVLDGLGEDQSDLKQILNIDLERSFQRGRLSVSKNERALRTQRIGADVQNNIEALVNGVRSGGDIDAALARVTLTTAPLDEVARAGVNDIAADQLYQAFTEYRVETDPRVFKAELSNGDYDAVFDPALKSKALRGAQLEIEAQDRVAEAQTKEAARERERQQKEALASERVDLQFDITDHIASLQSTGERLPGMTPARVTRLLGEKGAKRFARQEQQALAMFNAVSGIETEPPEVMAARLQSLAPVPGQDNFANQQDLFESASKQVQSVLQARRVDPAKAALQVGSVTALRQVLSQEGASAEDYGRYVNAALAAQSELGIPARDQKILTVSERDNFVTEFGRSRPDQYRDLLSGFAAYGPHQSRVMGELIEAGLSQGVEAVWSLSGQDNAQTSLISALQSDKDLKSQMTSGDVRKLDDKVAAEMEGLFGTFSASPDNARLRNTYGSAAEALARQYVSQGMKSSDAAKKAASAFSETYEVEGTYRVPKSRDPKNVKRGVGLIERTLSQSAPATGTRAPGVKASGALDVLPPEKQWWGLGPDGVGLSDDFRRQEYGRSIARDGRWITNPDETGLSLVMNGGGLDIPVLDRNGLPVDLSWSDIAGIGGGFEDLGGVRFNNIGMSSERIADIIINRNLNAERQND